MIAAERLSEWDKVSAPYPDRPGDTPPPWPVTDSRTPECQHDAMGPWGRKGERQRHGVRCDRWIWDRMWWPS